MKVLVTGGTGFLGAHLVEELRHRGHTVQATGRAGADLRDADEANMLVAFYAPDAVVHLAAVVGGINFNKEHPASLWRDNLLMGLNVLDACVAQSVGRLVLVGTCCSYPRNAPLPLEEESLWDGLPEPTNAPYGLAKRALLDGCHAYHRQYGLDVGSVIPANLYGAGDTFGPRAHVIADIIRKVVEARLVGKQTLRLQGTGNETRDFLHAADCARGIALMMEAAGQAGPINLGTGRETSVATIALLVAKAVGWEGTFEWHAPGPAGQPRRCVDATHARRILGWEPQIDLQDGIREAVAWYEKEVCVP